MDDHGLLDVKPVFGRINKLLSDYDHIVEFPNGMRLQAWCCKDLLEDTSLAIDAYIYSNQEKWKQASEGDLWSEIGEFYLKCYGVLQAMTLQRDCIKSLCEAIGFGYQTAEIFDVANDLRISVCGHPVCRNMGDYKQNHGTFFLSRLWCSRDEIHVRAYPESRFASKLDPYLFGTFGKIDFRKLIIDFRNALIVALSSIEEHLKTTVQHANKK